MVKRACDRPKRNDGINISCITQENKTVINCYGHDGAGFVTLFGSISETMNLIGKLHLDTSTPIRVIGAGCMGLTLAITLYKKGFHNIRISAKELYDIPSWRAGGYFDPGTGEESTSEERYELMLSLITYETLELIEQGKHDYFTSAVVKRLPIYAPKDIKTGTEILEQRGHMPPSELVTIDFGNNVVHHNFVKHHTYFIKITELMKQLWKQIELLQIPVTKEEITSFAQCEESIICNCSGLGGKKLNNDESMYPARGHFFMLPLMPAAENSMDYMIFVRIPRGNTKEYIYFFPKDVFVSSENNNGLSCVGMLGGTYIDVDQLSDQERESLDQIEWQRLYERSRNFFYGDQHNEIIH
jgi:hypothetical protein